MYPFLHENVDPGGFPARGLRRRVGVGDTPIVGTELARLAVMLNQTWPNNMVSSFNGETKTEYSSIANVEVSILTDQWLLLVP
jgi:hypothetical protein